MTIRRKVRSKPTPNVGDCREVRKFLLFPKCLAGEWRWLGRERIVQHFREWTAMVPETRGVEVCGWVDVRWAQ